MPRLSESWHGSRPTAKRITSGASGQATAISIARLAGNFTQAVLIVIVARESGPTTFGFIAALIAILAFVYEVADFGLNVSLIKALAQKDARSLNSAKCASNLGYAAMTLLAGGLVAISSLILHPDVALAMTLLAVGLGSDRYSETRICLLIADDKGVRAGIFVFVKRLLLFVVFFTVLAFGTSAIDALGVGQVIAGLSAAAGSILLTGCPTWARIGERTTLNELRTTLSSAVPFWLNNLSVQARMLDIVGVGFVCGGATAGAYAASSRLLNPLLVVPGTLASVVLPRATRGGIQWVRTITRHACIGFLLLFALCFFVAIVGRLILQPLLGSAYESAEGIFTVLMVGVPFIVIAAPLGAILQALGEARFVSHNSVGVAVLILPLAAFGGWIGGGVGAASLVSLLYFAKCCGLLIRLNRVGVGYSTIKSGV